MEREMEVNESGAGVQESRSEKEPHERKHAKKLTLYVHVVVFGADIRGCDECEERM
jgi:hypothetical protein